ncbi:MAG: cadherin repeat domain-containing protein, partial [Gammaproteobacteria bacterium]|nr:cadherin repeat domain-containing protein [Gammaproteobacteria bacterium]
MEEQQNKDADNGSASEVIDKTKIDGGNLSEPSPTFPVNPEPYSDVAPHRLPVTEDSASGQPNAQRNAQVDIASLESEKEKDEEKDEEKDKDKEDDEKEETETDNEVATDDTLGQTDLLEPMQETEEAETAEAASGSGGSLFSPSTLGWSAAALAGLGLALSGGGDDDEPPLEVPTVSLDTDTGTEGDGITTTGVFSVGNLESNATWEFSLDGGSSWNAGQGNSFTITEDGSYSVSVRQTRDGTNFEVSAQLSITIDTVAPVISSGASAGAIDENSGASQVIYTANSDDSAEAAESLSYSLADGSDAALSIDPVSGAVTLDTDPNFETQSQYSFTVVATDGAGNAGEQSVTVDINDLDEVAPVLLSIDSSVADETVTLAYDEALSETAIPDIADFSVKQNASELTITAVSIVGDQVILSLSEAPPSGPLQVTYTGGAIQDIAGNIGPQFTQIIVSDGYLRGVEIYADDNNDGIADPDELLEGVTSNAEGEIILEGDLASSNLIITSGVNVDTGAVNEFSLSAPAGYSVVNPITTLVSSIINNSAGATSTEDAEALVIESLGLELGDGGAGLSGYDPISDQSEDALANRVVTAQVASILAVAASSGEDEAASEAAQQAVLNNLVATIETAAPLVLDSESVAELLTGADGESLVDVELLAELGSAVDQLSEVDSLDAIVSVQAALTDKIAPDAPSLDLSDETDSGIKGDVITSQAAPTIRISFEVEAVDGTSVVVGDTVSFWNPEVTTIEGAASVKITQVDLENGFIDIAIEELSEGLTTFNSLVTDIAGNQSALAALPVRLDTTKPVITSDDLVGSIDENSGAGQAVYTVTADDVGGGLSFSLVEGSDTALSIDATTGIVSLSTDPDFETQDDYSFTVRATDAAGNVSESLPLLLGIGNEDESQPSITSLDSSLAVEGGGEGQIVYTATSDDSGDISGGVTYTLAENSDPLLSINSLNGQVTLAANPDAEVQSEYLMTIVAADGAGFTDSKDVTILVDTGPLITSSLFSAVTENDPSNQIVYTATATNIENPDEAITFSFGTVADDRLSIDSQSGQVTLLESPNFEATPEYAFTVKATAESGKATEQLVRVEVANLDEVAPPLTSGAIATAIDENSGAGQVVYTATADDSADISGGFSFSL